MAVAPPAGRRKNPMTKRAILWGATVSAFLPSVTIGCVGQDSSPPASGTNDVYSVGLAVSTENSLPGWPQCPSSMSGTVAHVDSPPSLWRCSSGKWNEISCTTSGGGTVAYASSPPTLWACVHSQWTEVALPDAGPPGPRGPAGPPGEAGITPTITVTPEPAGSNCVAGGIRVDVESDGTPSTSYVCNGVSAGGSDAGLDASDGEAGLNAIQQYAARYGDAYCTGLGKCCPGYDAGAFDHAACANAWTTSGWEFTLPPNSVVYARNNLLFNEAASAGCIAALENFACTPPSGTPLTNATQYAAVTNACLGVLTGTIANGVGGCLSSFECARGYCDLPSDGGAGTCTALVGTGGTD